MSEFDWIARYFRPLTRNHPDSLHLQDDAALITPPAGFALTITTDMLHEGVHFLNDTPPALVAHKALRCNLSDLAAMGAVPYAYSLALGLPAQTDEAWIESFCAALDSDQQAFNCFLLGGDTTRTHGPLSIAITAYGLTPAGGALTRHTAQIGDDIYVSGTIGDGYAGLHMRLGKLPADDATIARYDLPQPRLALGQSLIGAASACMDVSDGLLQDLGHICAASHCAAALDATRIPFSTPVQHLLGTGELHLADLVTGGDDYELLFTASPLARTKLEAMENITRIGTMREGTGVTLYDAHGDVLPITQSGYQHF